MRNATQYLRALSLAIIVLMLASITAQAQPPGNLTYGRLQAISLTTTQRTNLTEATGDHGTMNGTLVYDTTLQQLFLRINTNWWALPNTAFVPSVNGHATNMTDTGYLIITNPVQAQLEFTGGSGSIQYYYVGGSLQWYQVQAQNYLSWEDPSANPVWSITNNPNSAWLNGLLTVASNLTVGGGISAAAITNTSLAPNTLIGTGINYMETPITVGSGLTLFGGVLTANGAGGGTATNLVASLNATNLTVWTNLTHTNNTVVNEIYAAGSAGTARYYTNVGVLGWQEQIRAGTWGWEDINGNVLFGLTNTVGSTNGAGFGGNLWVATNLYVNGKILGDATYLTNVEAANLVGQVNISNLAILVTEVVSIVNSNLPTPVISSTVNFSQTGFLNFTNWVLWNVGATDPTTGAAITNATPKGYGFDGTNHYLGYFVGGPNQGVSNSYGIIKVVNNSAWSNNTTWTLGNELTNILKNQLNFNYTNMGGLMWFDTNVWVNLSGPTGTFVYGTNDNGLSASSYLLSFASTNNYWITPQVFNGHTNFSLIPEVPQQSFWYSTQISSYDYANALQGQNAVISPALTNISGVAWCSLLNNYVLIEGQNPNVGTNNLYLVSPDGGAMLIKSNLFGQGLGTQSAFRGIAVSGLTFQGPVVGPSTNGFYYGTFTVSVTSAGPITASNIPTNIMSGGSVSNTVAAQGTTITNNFVLITNGQIVNPGITNAKSTNDNLYGLNTLYGFLYDNGTNQIQATGLIYGAGGAFDWNSGSFHIDSGSSFVNNANMTGTGTIAQNQIAANQPNAGTAYGFVNTQGPNVIGEGFHNNGNNDADPLAFQASGGISAPYSFEVSADGGVETWGGIFELTTWINQTGPYTVSPRNYQMSSNMPNVLFASSSAVAGTLAITYPLMNGAGYNSATAAISTATVTNLGMRTGAQATNTGILGPNNTTHLWGVRTDSDDLAFMTVGDAGSDPVDLFGNTSFKVPPGATWHQVVDGTNIWYSLSYPSDNLPTAGWFFTYHNLGDYGWTNNAGQLTGGNATSFFSSGTIPTSRLPANLVTLNTNDAKNLTNITLTALPKSFTYTSFTNGSTGATTAFSTYYTNTFNAKIKVKFECSFTDQAGTATQVGMYVFSPANSDTEPPFFIGYPAGLATIATNYFTVELGTGDYVAWTNTIGTAAAITNRVQY